MVKQSVEASLETVKASLGARWAWLMLNSQESRLKFECSQGVKHENLMDQDLRTPVAGESTGDYVVSPP